MRNDPFLEETTLRRMQESAKWMDMTEILPKEGWIDREGAEYVFLNLLQGGLNFVPVRSEFSTFMLLDEHADLRDFIYWRKYEAIAFNVYGTTTHQAAMSQLYLLEWMARNPVDGDILDRQDHAESLLKKTKKGIAEHKQKGYICPSMMAEWFVTEGYGMFMSSQSPCIQMGEDTVMSFAERMVFKTLKQRRV